MKFHNAQMLRLANCFLLPTDILPGAAGQAGFSVTRIAAATSMLAVSLAAMRLTSSMLVASIVIPIWCAAIGTLVDGRRGFSRGVILSVVYPIYASIVATVCLGVFWLYALLHQMISA